MNKIKVLATTAVLVLPAFLPALAEARASWT